MPSSSPLQPLRTLKKTSLCELYVLWDGKAICYCHQHCFERLPRDENIGINLIILQIALFVLMLH
jgi:hypothetical protein